MKHFRLYCSNRMEKLAEALAQVAVQPTERSFERDLVVVQSRGMERWVRFELARRNGICANVEFPFPVTFLNDMFRAVLADFDDNAEAAFRKPVLAWRIMGLLERPDFAGRPELSALRRCVGDGPRRQTRIRQSAERLSELFDQYLVYRPEMVRGWESEQLTYDNTDEAWQALLWRDLAPRGRGLHRAAARDAFVRALRDGKGPLPEKVCVFGISSMPVFMLDAFLELSRRIPVHFFLLNPCRDTTWLDGGSGLLDSTGALHREFLWALRHRGVSPPGNALFETSPDLTLLARIQNGILDGEPDGERSAVASDDRSAAVHACHGPLREIEVLYDNLLDAFATMPGLRPRDVVVMTPDIESYASHIHAVFGGRSGERRIPYSVADRSAVRESRVADTFLSLLELADSRFEASRVEALFDSPALRAKFDLSPADVDRCRRWIADAGIRWGLDVEPGGPAFGDNTWRAGLDRMLLGYAMRSRRETAFEHPDGDILPYDEIEGDDAVTLGKLTCVSDKLFGFAREATRPRLSPADWTRLLLQALDDFFAADEDSEREFQLVRSAVTAFGDDAALAGYDGAVDLDVVRSHLGTRLESEDFGRGFLTGGVTFCSMLPMRCIPFRVICLVGMNEDAFPRKSPRVGFDLMQREPRPGDPSRRKDDRAIFLEALLSARERLYVSYVGFNVRTNERIPPSVMVSELLDHIESQFDAPGGILDLVRTEHRLHPFSADYYRDGSKLFSYSAEYCDTARAALSPRIDRFDFFPSSAMLPESDADRDAVELDALLRFFRNPAKFLLNESLGIRYETESGESTDDEPFATDYLDRYKFQSELAKKHIESPESVAPYIRAVRSSGLLPHGGMGDVELDVMRTKTARFATEVRAETGDSQPSGIEISLDLAVPQHGAMRLSGVIDRIYDAKRVVYRHANAKAKDYLRVWLEHLALCAAASSPVSSVLVMYEKEKEGKLLIKDFPPIPNAKEILSQLIGLFFDGLRRPLPFMPDSSFIFAEVASSDTAENALDAAKRKWLPADPESEFSSGETDDPCVRRCFGDAWPGDDFERDFMQIAARVFAGYPFDT